MYIIFCELPKFITTHLIVDQALEQQGARIKEKGIKIIRGVPNQHKIYADPVLFSQVIINLLSNAVKFCQRGDEICFFSPDDSCENIAISDTGTGVPPHIIKNIFVYETTTSSVGTAGEVGTGLGLPFSYEIVKAHGGTIKIETEKERGTTFFFIFQTPKTENLN